MPNTSGQEVSPTQGFAGDLVIETFDQWHNPADLWMNNSRVCLTTPADAMDLDPAS